MAFFMNFINSVISSSGPNPHIFFQDLLKKIKKFSSPSEHYSFYSEFYDLLRGIGVLEKFEVFLKKKKSLN